VNERRNRKKTEEILGLDVSFYIKLKMSKLKEFNIDI